MKILTLDVGGTAIKSALMNNGEMENPYEIPSEAKKGAPFLLKNIEKIIDDCKEYDAIGISTAGQVDSDKGSIIFANENIPEYTGTKLKEMLEAKYKKPVFVENDVNAAAIGEAYYGAAKGVGNFLCLTYGTGIGGAIIIDNKVYGGSGGVAGEMGHILTHPDGKECACGQKGCYEQYASCTALVKNSFEVNPKWGSGRIIFKGFYSGQEKAKKVIDSWIDEIILGLVTLVHIFNPSCIVLGGGIMNEQYIIDRINELLPQKIMPSYRNVEVKHAKLGNNAGLYGMLATVERKMK